ncbi:MAG: hypothetical protein JWP28_3810 [Phenylobacterium sp.]|uniref:nucleotidyltransferase domain-containing protein n=1 Tax=Phenylobacterium sp. TaxID=1871053 RepID=UPI00260DE906|nr:nucleotidyltransferase domain-containing protein [Phenylobacterium sp.]MDB5499779.1 hypothetical protein [Phenylobacterium sp.]
MPTPKDPGLNPVQPTPYADLNAVLAHLVEGARGLLGDNFVGAYLQGSFAVGDFTEFSDCDFIIVTARDITRDELPPFQALHAAIHQMPYAYWRTGLEGSYAPASILRRCSETPRDPPGEPRGPTGVIRAGPAVRRGPIRSGTWTTGPRPWCGRSTTTPRWSAGACGKGAWSWPVRIHAR